MSYLVAALLFAFAQTPADGASDSPAPGVVSTTPEAPAWGRFRGPDGTGLAAPGGTYPMDLSAPERLAWKRPVPPGQSSPIVARGRVFLTSYDEGRCALHAYDLASGEPLWEHAVEVQEFERTQNTHGPASPTPTTYGDRVFAYFGSFGLLACDLDGRELWRRELPVPRNTFGTASSPIVVDGKLILCSDADEDAFFAALDPASGAILWQLDRKGRGSSWSTPTPWIDPTRRELLVYGAFHLAAHSLDDGRELWSVPGLADEPICTPLVGAGLVYVTSYNMRTNDEVLGPPTFAALLSELDTDGDRRLSRAEAEKNPSVLSRPDADGQGDHPLRMFFRMLDKDRDGTITAEEYPGLQAWLDTFEHANGVVAIAPPQDDQPARVAWTQPRGVPECPSPLLLDGRLHFVRNGGVVTCLDARNGEVLHRERLAARGPYYASPVASDRALYLVSSRGELTVLARGPHFEVLSTLDLEEGVFATPALAQGMLIVRSEGHLLAFRAGSED